jgi:DNA-binding GntR family transcriptional regulator
MASRRVYRILREEILAGTLKPGQRLVRQKVAKRIGVSAIPVLEALHSLEREGLVEQNAMQGARVKVLSSDQLKNDLILREAIESQVARILAAKAKTGELDAEDLMRRARELDAFTQTDNNAGMEMHMAFHLHTAQLAGYPILVEELKKVWSRSFMLHAWLMLSVSPIPNWHQVLVEAILSGDPLRADEAARYHVTHSPHDQETIEAMSAKTAH